MSNGTNVLDSAVHSPVTVMFGERFANSEQFDAIFKEGMTLVERTASYLDREGRAESKKLKQPVSVVYATESMRLTTRLLELASWLLVRRALKHGDISRADAQKKRARIRLAGQGRPSHTKHFPELPAGLRRLIEQSWMLHDRIVQLDRAMEGATEPRGPGEPNPVAAQLSRLEVAFAGNRQRVQNG
jgi:regulator of CtrA degradation